MISERGGQAFKTGLPMHRSKCPLVPRRTSVIDVDTGCGLVERCFPQRWFGTPAINVSVCRSTLNLGQPAQLIWFMSYHWLCAATSDEYSRSRS
eukprot:m.373739 g.373739  ORF g.373739 m.373739 type:complete len:94 (+) comp16691_c3_seq2:3111-3392(+)